jgi:predicted acetyltransferase
VELVRPGREQLPSYFDALQRGYSPNSTRPEATADELGWIDADPAGFLDSLDNRRGDGPPILLPDGSAVPRLPGFHRWMWDGSFCGAINARWQDGTTELPPHCLGHIGYTVVGWKRRRGYASAALALVLPELRAIGLPCVEITTDLDNHASQKVIVANGGVLIEHFDKPAAFGEPRAALRFRIPLDL